MNKTLKELEAEGRAIALEALRLRNLRNPTAATPQTKSPSIAEMAVSASGSLIKWVGSGLSQSTQYVIDLRLDICKGCEFWDAEALNGTGRCLKCGCATWAKIRMATERCPIGKWEPVSGTELDPKTAQE